ncbi:hypothetical protein C4882_02470 [Cronobacter malonaticus]|nr:hypothetical protein C4882_02470 [Cronobacter malonaticus]
MQANRYVPAESESLKQLNDYILKTQKSPHERAFSSLGSRGSFAYPFLSLLRLVAVRVKWLTCCF